MNCCRCVTLRDDYNKRRYAPPETYSTAQKARDVSSSSNSKKRIISGQYGSGAARVGDEHKDRALHPPPHISQYLQVEHWPGYR